MFGVSLRQQTDKEKDVPVFLSRLVARIRAQEGDSRRLKSMLIIVDIAKEIYWIDSEFDPGIDNLQVSFSKGSSVRHAACWWR